MMRRDERLATEPVAGTIPPADGSPPVRELAELQFLNGIRPFDFLRLVARHRISISPRTLRRAGQVLFVGWLARLAERSGIPASRPVRKPVFIIGHWRSGTSILQRLLACDPRFRTPAYRECAFPRARTGLHGWFLERLREKLPETRGFDAFPLALDSEFEDEFALLKLALESPMLASIFPKDAWNTWRRQFEHQPSENWCRQFRGFAEWLAPETGELLFKAPAHAFRVPTLVAMFPDARFINVRRDPAEVFLSTYRLEQYLLANNSLQGECTPDRELILERMRAHARAVEAAREQLPAEQFAELHLDDLQREPLRQLESLCCRLNLGAFRPCASRFEDAAVALMRHRSDWRLPDGLRKRDLERDVSRVC